MALTHTAPPPASASADEQRKLRKRLADLRVAMLTTNDRDGTLSARPVSSMRRSALAGAWFPGGPEDPNLGLLRVDVVRGDYWDVGSSKLVQFFSLATAAITRTPPRETGAHKQFGT